MESDKNQDDLILAQKEAIEKEIASSIPLVGSCQDFSQVVKELSATDFAQKVEKLSESYEKIRRIRPDGNCFFRSLGFRYFQLLLQAETELKRFKDKIAGSAKEMADLGFPSFTVQDFYDNFMETLEKLGSEIKSADPDLCDLYNDQGLSDYLVVFLRLLTSMQLQKECEFYQNFMEGGQTVAEFCNTDVEPMYRESDHIHIIALTAATGINVRIIYLDRGSNKEASIHDFPEGSKPEITLLYRPGHYDILYPKI